MIKWLIKKIEKEILKDISEDISKMVSEKASYEQHELNWRSDWAESQEKYLNSEKLLDDLVLRLKKKQLKG